MKHFVLLALISGCSGEVELDFDSTSITSGQSARMRIVNGTSKGVFWNPCMQQFVKDGVAGPRLFCIEGGHDVGAGWSSKTFDLVTPDEPGAWDLTITVEHDGATKTLTAPITIRSGP